MHEREQLEHEQVLDVLPDGAGFQPDCAAQSVELGTLRRVELPDAKGTPCRGRHSLWRQHAAAIEQRIAWSQKQACATQHPTVGCAPLLLSSHSTA